MGKAADTKQFIIATAGAIYNKKGIAGTTVDDVLAAAKVARGCLYNHFENKEALSNATVKHLLDKTLEKYTQLVNGEQSARKKIHAYLDFSKAATNNTYIQGGCPILNISVEADDNSPDIKKKVKAKLIAVQKLFTTILTEGIESGELSEELNAEEFAFKMFSAIEGAIVFCRILGSNKPIELLVTELKAELESYAM